MNENMKAFIAAVSDDDELRDEMTALVNELNAATEEERPELIARLLSLAEDKGLTLTEEDLAFEAPAEGKLEDEELMVVSGGCDDPDLDKANCGCAHFCGTSNLNAPKPMPIPNPHK